MLAIVVDAVEDEFSIGTSVSKIGLLHTSESKLGELGINRYFFGCDCNAIEICKDDAGALK